MNASPVVMMRGRVDRRPCKLMQKMSLRASIVAIQCFLFIGVPCRFVGAAQLPGLPPPVAPDVDRHLEIFFGNDFFGRGGEDDDFRTQHFGVTMDFGERWIATVDHSILTLEEPRQGDPGRLDQLSGSVGYALLREVKHSSRQTLNAGVGFRYSGDVAGARIQNGFHQLGGASIKTMPYVDTDRLDGFAWLQFNRDGVLQRDMHLPMLGQGWDFGYWARLSTLLTSDGQSDGNVGLMAVTSRSWFSGWLGLQGDWRSGYDRDNVTRETARYEEGGAVVLGFRFGPLIIETEQQFDGDSATGHMSLVSTGEALTHLADGNNSFGLQLGLSMPDVYASLQGRWMNCNILACTPNWRRTGLLELRYGQPQFGNDTSRFVETWQVSAGVEFERAPVRSLDWMTAYGSLAVGWRSEGLAGEGDEIGGLSSESVDRVGLAGNAGLRFGTNAGNDSWSLMLDIGLSAWLPSSDGDVMFNNTSETLQSAELIFFSGVLFQFMSSAGHN
jgi:hypothetical protein